MTTRRTPMVVLGAVVGLVAIGSFHASPAALAMTTTAPAPTSRSAPTPTPTNHSTAQSAPATSSTSVAPSTVRSQIGSTVNYNYGTLAVSVTVQGKTITNISVPSLNDGGNSYSQSLDSMSIPILTKEAMAAQSAHIQSVSGASYTSAGFIQSLQSALTALGI
jgi:uncharacterized protein with FMN-binding domain